MWNYVNGKWEKENELKRVKSRPKGTVHTIGPMLELCARWARVTVHVCMAGDGKNRIAFFGTVFQYTRRAACAFGTAKPLQRISTSPRLTEMGVSLYRIVNTHFHILYTCLVKCVGLWCERSICVYVCVVCQKKRAQSKIHSQN